MEVYVCSGHAAVELSQRDAADSCGCKRRFLRVCTDEDISGGIGADIDKAYGVVVLRADFFVQTARSIMQGRYIVCTKAALRFGCRRSLLHDRLDVCKSQRGGRLASC